jgi:hypothetical protein
VIHEATELCFGRALEVARSTLEYALALSELHPQARLLRACVCLEEGQWQQASGHLAVPGLQDTPEAHLLRELAERRPRAPDWRHAFFEAWQAAGQPDFRQSKLLPPPRPELAILDDTWGSWKKADEARRFLLAVLNVEMFGPHEAWGLEQVRACQSIPLLLAFRQQLSLAGQPERLLQAFLPVVEEQLMQLAGPSTRTLQLALLPFVFGTSPDAPFTRRELEALEALTPLTEWKQPSTEQTFLEMRERFQGLLRVPANHAYVMARSAQGEFIARRLLERGLASKAHLPEEERRWMGRLLWEVGTRLCTQRSDAELTLGVKLQMYGSEQSLHGPSRDSSISLWVELGHWEKAVERSGVYRWPLASLQEEACEVRARDELAWLHAFAGKGPLP